MRGREKAANPIPRSSPTVVMAEGGEKTQPRPERKASGRSPGFFAFNQGYSRSAGSLF